MPTSANTVAMNPLPLFSGLSASNPIDASRPLKNYISDFK